MALRLLRYNSLYNLSLEPKEESAWVPYNNRISVSLRAKFEAYDQDR